jgi:hypothetical protein
MESSGHRASVLHKLGKSESMAMWNRDRLLMIVGDKENTKPSHIPTLLLSHAPSLQP